MKKSIISISLSMLLLGGCVSSPSISESDIFQQYPNVREANTLLEKASADNLAFFAPEKMKEAQRVYANALKDAKAGKTNAGQLGEEAAARVNAARVQSDKAKYTFENVLLAREKALKVNASTVTPENFKEAKETFSRAITQLALGQNARVKRC
jgi:NADH dehydrogenase/NADH:ubiquinone oxidoreductase subunit G